MWCDSSQPISSKSSCTQPFPQQDGKEEKENLKQASATACMAQARSDGQDPLLTSGVYIQDQLQTMLEQWLEKQDVCLQTHLSEQRTLVSDALSEVTSNVNRFSQMFGAPMPQFQHLNGQANGCDIDNGNGICLSEREPLPTETHKNTSRNLAASGFTLEETEQAKIMERSKTSVRVASCDDIDNDMGMRSVRVTENRQSQVHSQVNKSNSMASADTMMTSYQGVCRMMGGGKTTDYYVEDGGRFGIVPEFTVRKKCSDVEEEAHGAQRHGMQHAILEVDDIVLTRYLEINGPISRLLYWILRVVTNPCFDCFFGVVILSSMVVVGFEIEYQSHNGGKAADEFNQITLVLNCLFTLEVALRLLGYQGIFFQRGKRAFNMLDLGFAVFALFEIIYVSIGESEERNGSGNATRVIRMVRLVRVARPARLLRVAFRAREFQKMIAALQDTFQTLIWALIILTCFGFVFAIIFVQGSTEYFAMEVPLNEAEIAVAEDLEYFFAHLPNAYTSLYMSISGGIDWDVLTRALRLANPNYPILFMVYNFICVFGVLNVITSVFVDSVMRSSLESKELLMQEEENKKTNWMKHFKNVFEQLDVDQSGGVSIEELSAYLNDDDLKNYLEALGVGVDEYTVLFRLLDKDESGTIDYSEFCEGLMKIRGEAKSFDIHCIMYENARFLRKWSAFTMDMESRLIEIGTNLEFSIAIDPDKAAARAMMRENRYQQDDSQAVGRSLSSSLRVNRGSIEAPENVESLDLS